MYDCANSVVSKRCAAGVFSNSHLNTIQNNTYTTTKNRSHRWHSYCLRLFIKYTYVRVYNFKT